jgi:hypothetical protein
MAATPLLCITFCATLAVTTQCLLISMHLILMLRGLFVLQCSLNCHSKPTNANPLLVFALYIRKRWIVILLLSLLGTQNVAQAISVIYTIPAVAFNPICHIERIPRLVAMHGSVQPLSSHSLTNFCARSFATLSMQTTILGLTIIKCFVALRAGWGRVPLVKLIVRDGTLSFIVISGEPRFHRRTMSFLHTTAN